MKSRLLLFGCAAVALISVVSWTLYDSPEPSPDPSGDEMASMQKKLQRLEREVSSSAAYMRHAQHAALQAQHHYEERAVKHVDDAPGDAPGEPTTPQEPAEDVEVAGATPQEAQPDDPDPVVLSERLDSAFFDESSDPEWTPGATETAEKLALAMRDNADVTNVECRASLCRLESTFSDLASFHESTVRAVTDPDTGWPGPYMAAVVSDPRHAGAVEAVTYLAREGVDLSPDGIASAYP